MKPEIHPDYHTVVFKDISTGDEFVTRSTVTSSEMRELDGEQVPVVSLDITSASHPIWTGKVREVDTAGRIERFRRRYGMSSKKADEAPADEASADGAPAQDASSDTPAE